MAGFETIPDHPEYPGSDLNAEQRALMSEVGQVALAIVEIEAEERSGVEEVKIAEALTDTIVERTQLKKDVVQQANRWLLGKNYLDRSGFSEPGSNKALQLSLNEEGLHFLAEEIEKVRS